MVCLTTQDTLVSNTAIHLFCPTPNTRWYGYSHLLHSFSQASPSLITDFTCMFTLESCAQKCKAFIFVSRPNYCRNPFMLAFNKTVLQVGDVPTFTQCSLITSIAHKEYSFPFSQLKYENFYFSQWNTCSPFLTNSAGNLTQTKFKSSRQFTKKTISVITISPKPLLT